MTRKWTPVLILSAIVLNTGPNKTSAADVKRASIDKQPMASISHPFIDIFKSHEGESVVRKICILADKKANFQQAKNRCRDLAFRLGRQHGVSSVGWELPSYSDLKNFCRGSDLIRRVFWVDSEDATNKLDLEIPNDRAESAHFYTEDHSNRMMQGKEVLNTLICVVWYEDKTGVAQHTIR